MTGNIAIITARGGSKRIPKKNIRDFLGLPIIAYPIKAAIESKLFDTVMVSTDSDEIAQIAKKYGASVPFMRSEATSNDFAGTSDVLYEVISEYEKSGQTFKNLCCIYPTSPLITSVILTKAYDAYLQSGADCLVPVVRFSFPPQRAFMLNNGMATPVNPTDFIKRSQDLEPLYHDCGQFYFTEVAAFMQSRNLLAKSAYAYIMPENHVQDIDNEEDWILAELKYKALTKKLGGQI